MTSISSFKVIQGQRSVQILNLLVKLLLVFLHNYGSFLHHLAILPRSDRFRVIQGQRSCLLTNLNLQNIFANSHWWHRVTVYTPQWILHFMTSISPIQSHDAFWLIWECRKFLPLGTHAIQATTWAPQVILFHNLYFTLPCHPRSYSKAYSEHLQVNVLLLFLFQHNYGSIMHCLATVHAITDRQQTVV